MRGDEALDGVSIHIHDFNLLRQCFNAAHAFRARRRNAQRFGDRFLKFGRLRRFQHQRRHVRPAMLRRDFESVSRMRIHHDAVACVDVADRSQAVGMRTFAGDEAKFRQVAEMVGIFR